MFKEEFFITLLILMALVMLLYVNQPGFAERHAWLVHFFSPSTATSTPGQSNQPVNAKISPVNRR